MRTYCPSQASKSCMLFILLLLTFTSHAFAAASAGRIDFAFGTVTAISADGVTRKIAKGSDIFSGDSITTTDGRVQIRFTDGAYVALQPNTVFKIDQYLYEGKSDGKEKGSFSLVKGGLRTITGAIGKVNKQNYEVRTPTATIGIRGTAYSATQSEDGLIVTVTQGLVSVSNQGGSMTLGAGQSALVRTPSSGPEMSDQRSAPDHIPAPQQADQNQDQQQPLATNTATTAGEQRTPDGRSLLLATPRPGYGLAWAYGAASPTTLDNVTANFSGDNLVAFDGSASLQVQETNQVQDAGWDGLIGWGRWTGNVIGSAPGAGLYSQEGGIHYVTGKISSQDQINLRAGTEVTYSLVGATQPSTTLGGTTTLGTFSGYLSVNFSAIPTMTMHATITDAAAGINYNLAGIGPLSMGVGLTPSFSAGRSGFEVPGIPGPATINVNGLFVGSSAERLGIAYEINSGGAQTSGSAAFKAP